VETSGGTPQPDDIMIARILTNGLIYCYPSSGVTASGVSSGTGNDTFYGVATYDRRLT